MSRYSSIYDNYLPGSRLSIVTLCRGPRQSWAKRWPSGTDNDPIATTLSAVAKTFIDHYVPIYDRPIRSINSKISFWNALQKSSQDF